MAENNVFVKQAVQKYQYLTKPYAHQKTALELSAFKKNFAYFMEMGCVDGEVEFLTNRGWWKFKDFDLVEWEAPLLVAQCIPDVKTNEWAVQLVEPISYIRKPATEWIRFRSRYNKHLDTHKLDLWVTKDHNMPCITRDCIRGHKDFRDEITYRYDDYTAEDLCKYINSSRAGRKTYHRFFDKFHKCLPAESSYPKLIDEELNSLSEFELRFMVAAIADGTFPNKFDNKCDFYFKKERKVERLQMLCARAGIPCTYRKVEGRFRDIHEMHTIAPIKTKEFNERWYTLPPEKLNIIAEEVFYWDGWQGNASNQYSTTIQNSADFLETSSKKTHLSVP